MTTLPGYELSECLYEGPRTEVYRATRSGDRCSRDASDRVSTVIVKILRTAHPNFTQLVQFRNQYAIARHLEHPNILTPLALERYGNGYALIMPDDGAIALNDYWQQKTPSTEEFLEIAIQLADALHYLGQEQIIHKDIKPANILICRETKQVKLIDFSISSLLPKETQTIQTVKVLEGTLAYLSPEQTGRMNRGIDYRSDFYALGVTFYELLTGTVPFASDDPLELIHAHIAQSPEPVTGDPIPQVLSDIVLKLMAKNAEDRYQSALGLKYDLEKCLSQYKETKEIESFPLGERDLCDRFLVPEKLYGREAEVERLFAAFERVAEGKSELMLVAGFSGIGKTAVVNEVHKPIVRERGYFIKGKFDQFNRNIPFSALVQSLGDLMGQILSESDTQLQQWKDKILEAVGENGQVIIEVIPELEKIIGKQQPVPELSGNAAQNRFNLLFGKFIQVFASQEHPLVIFLDDLQWADMASLNLMKLLMSEVNDAYLLAIGAYRDNEVFPAHPLMLTLDEMGKAQATINTITLAPLSQDNINCLVADTLTCDGEVAKPLTELVYQKTQGNPFFTTQFLLGLHGDELISFKSDLGYWECDITRVRQRALTDDVVKFMAGRLQKLPTETQEVLKLAACIGNQFDLQTLAVVCEQLKEDTADCLWKALQLGLILPQSEVYKFYLSQEKLSDNTKRNERARYCFLHDRVQQAAYSLIPKNKKQLTHLKIGKLLLQELSVQERSEKIFALVNQLNLGKAAISIAEEKQRLASLNLEAGKKARLSAAYQVAQDYCTTGINLLPTTAWHSDYELMYSLHRYGSEAAYLCGNFARAEALYTEALNHAQTALDKGVIYRIQMTQYQLQGRNTEAIAIQRQSILLLGWEIPTEQKLIETTLDEEIAKVRRFLEQQTVESILELPKMEDENIAEMLRILQILFYAGWLDGQPTLASIALAKMTTLSLEHGNSDMSPFGYVGYGLIANAMLKDATTAYQFGEMAVQLCEQFDNADVRGMTNFLFAADVHSWSRPIREADAYYENAYKYGMEAGNWLTVGFMMMLSGSDRLTYGKNLSELYSIAKTHADFLRHVKSLENLDALIVGVIQPIRNLLGLTKTIFTFDDDDFSESEYLQKYSETPYHLAWLYSVKIRNSYLFNDTVAYPNLIDKLEILENSITTHAKVPSSVFYVALMHIKLAELSESKKDADFHLKKLMHLEKKLNRWENSCPENISHKYLIIQAEKARINGKTTEAIDFYERAIATAKTNQYDYEEALANELAAKFYREWGKEKIASVYMTDAYYGYARWGAKAKVQDLEKRYPQLLKPILQKTNTNTNSEMGLSDAQTQTSSIINISSLVDFSSLLKAGRSLSKEIDLQSAIAKFMEVIQENAGAQTVALMLFQEDTLMLQAHATGEKMSLLQIPVETSNNVPKTLVYRVKNTHEHLVLDNAKENNDYNRDDYINKYQPKSVLCMPLIDRGQLIGILYLENNQTSGAFTSDRIEILNLLCSQAAISLENAQLYNNLEIKVQERTAELSQALQNLKDTQKQLVESEKMASLGSLVAGVAHEINTPVGTCITVASTLNEETQAFAEAIANGQLKRSVLNNYIETCTECTQLIGSNLKRAGELIGSFKQVAVDRTHLEMRTFAIKPYLEEVLTSLMPNIRQQGHVVEVTGDETIQVTTYPGALAQIVTNLTNNSLVHGYPDGQSGQLNWRIELKEEKLMIEYEDDGCGIGVAELEKIFEPFYTTARNQGGTGLGLHIVYNLVTQKLLGNIWVESQVGKGVKFTLSIPK